MPRAERSSHFFLVLARGERMRSISMRPRSLYAASIGIPAIWVLSVMGALTVYEWASPTVVAIQAHQAEMRAAYDDRLAAMQQQLDLSARVEAGRRETFESRIHDLEQTQARLSARADTIAKIANSASGLDVATPTGTIAAVPHLPASSTSSISLGGSVPTGATDSDGVDGIGGVEKPRPDDLGSQPAPDDKSSSLEGPAAPGALTGQLAALTAGADRIQAEQIAAVNSVAARVAKAAEAARSLIASVGLSPDRFRRDAVRNASDEAMGGPYVPIRLDADGSPLETAFEQLQSAMTRDQAIAAVLPRLPIRSPLHARLEMTSPFGVRVDPFLGRLALHPGEDFRATVGEAVYATAAGRITNAGWDGGYGNMVEIDHGAGLITRYGHLSEIDVKVGQQVDVGQELGHAGSTGRSTGPHLHYEIRIDGQPVDPHRFVEASRTIYAAR